MNTDLDAEERHSPEPWVQQGRYIRDVAGEIVVRGRTAADARRIVAAVNATREIPTEALERWFALDVSDASNRPDLEVDVEEGPRSPVEVLPPSPFLPAEAPDAMGGDPPLIFDRRIFQRRITQRRWVPDRRRSDRRRASSPAAPDRDA